MSKGVMDLHDGFIGVNSAGEGLGSAFYIELPVEDLKPVEVFSNEGNCNLDIRLRRNNFHVAANTLKIQTPLRFQEDFPRVLIADDSAMCRKMVRRSIIEVCVACADVSSGDEVIEAVMQGRNEGVPFDVVVIDYHMQGMDGHKASAELRRLGFQGKIFGMTGDASQGKSSDFLSHGADQVFIKPIDTMELLMALQRFRE